MRSTDFDTILLEDALLQLFSFLPHSSVKVYLTLKLLEVGEDSTASTIEEIGVAASIPEKTVQLYIRDLVEHLLIEAVERSNPDPYKISYYGTYNEGFTRFSKSLVKDMIHCLSPSEMVLYVLLFSKSRGINKTKTSTSQQNLAQEIGVTLQALSLITTELNAKGYIKKETILIKENRKNTKYILRNN